MLTICICVQIKVRTICCERRPSYPPLTSVTRHKFYGGFNSFRDDCYRFWSPQHPRHEQLHGGTRKQINFQAPVLAPGFLLTAPWKYEPDFARNFNDMFELLSVQQQFSNWSASKAGQFQAKMLELNFVSVEKHARYPTPNCNLGPEPGILTAAWSNWNSH